ncbi:MAG TPA: hypothetical protein VLO07_06415, partial [Thermoanaerobaculia bacterium]|nr:hypothetical protein [Thermoanaerobaculia bacterium]
MGKRVQASVGRFAILWLLCGSPLVAVPPQASPPVPPTAGETIGVPWSGERGITETVAQIMERERHAPAIPVGPAREIKPRFDLKRLPRKQNPSAPAVSQWPPAEGQNKGAVLPDNPQAAGTSFLGTRFAESGFYPP